MFETNIYNTAEIKTVKGILKKNLIFIDAHLAALAIEHGCILYSTDSDFPEPQMAKSFKKIFVKVKQTCYIPNIMNNRQQILIDRLNNTGHLSVVNQSKELGVTEMTIRRDLQLLEKDGIATRVHGGAVPRSPVPHGVDIMSQKPRKNQVAIAKKAVKLLNPGSTVLFNVGTTVLQVAREIATLKIPLTVITNSLPVAVALYKSECQVILPGGTLRRQGLDLIGPITEKNLDEYHVDTLISGCDGADSKVGFFTNDVNLTPIEKKSVQIAEKTVIVTESAKFLSRSFAQFATIDDISAVVTDKELPESDIQNLRKAGIELYAI